MRWAGCVLVVGFLCVGSACWESHEGDRAAPPADPPRAGACAGEACGAAGAPADPFAPPARYRDQAPVENPGDGLCRAGELAVHCHMAPPLLPCPASYRDAVAEACKDGASTYQVECNACGGATIQLPGPFYTLAIHYDASNQLAGVTLKEDAPVGPCEQEEFVFGRHCTSTSRRESRACSEGAGVTAAN